MSDAVAEEECLHLDFEGVPTNLTYTLRHYVAGSQWTVFTEKSCAELMMVGKGRASDDDPRAAAQSLFDDGFVVADLDEE